jgi:tripartite-type tricarboxylate transporter receptor subunit TctC
MVLALAVSTTAGAQSWPTKPVRLIVPFPAGGGTDAFARPLAAHLSLQTGQQFVIDNRGGAGGTIGAELAAKAPADGYTFLVGAVHHAIAVSMYAKLGYDLEKDLTPVTLVSVVPNVLVLHPSVPLNSVSELIAYAKANPTKLNFASAGNGTSHHLAAELFKTTTGVQMLHIPYKGAGPAMQDLIGGQVNLMFDGMGSSATQIRGGKLKPLVNRLQVEVAKALAKPEVKEIWAAQGADAGGNSPAEFNTFIKAEIVKWAKVVKDSGAKID